MYRRGFMRSTANMARRVAGRAADRVMTGAIAAGINQAAKMSYRSAASYMRKPKSKAKSKAKAKPKSKQASIAKQVKDLKKVVNAGNGKLIYRVRNTTRALASVNSTAHVASETVQMSNYETVLGELRFFNPSTPGTLTQGSGATGTYTREYLFSQVYTNSQAVNNYQIPCKCTMYVCVPKEDTNSSPITAFTNGLADVGNPTATSPLVHLTDSDEFNDKWKIHSSKTKVLQPGQSMSLAYSNKDVQYSPATFDSHNLAYQKRFKCYFYVIRVEGVLAHDTTADQQGFAQAGVDISWDTKYVVTYDAGIDLTYIFISDNSDTFTNGAVVSSKPVADNIGYSVA